VTNSLRLRLDLVPRSCFFSNLRSELPKADWDKLRREQYSRAGHRCEICGGKGRRHPVECHERWNFTDYPGVQHLDGLIALCPACHEVKHMGLAEHRGNLGRAIKQFCRVNSMEKDDAMPLIRAEFDLWAKRSRSSWDLDISWLECQGVDTTKLEDACVVRRQQNAARAKTQMEELLVSMNRAHGACPPDYVRMAFAHDCGHAGIMQVPNPDLLPDDEAGRIVVLVQQTIEAPCPDCDSPDEPDQPTGVECTDGKFYDVS